MAIGALFTLFFANGSFGSVGQQVASLESTQTTTTTLSANCDDPLQYESSACSNVVNKKPPVSFEVVGSPAALVGSVSVHVNVAHAKHVTLVVYSQSLNRVIELGSMANISSTVWEFPWNTSAFNDGSYKLRAYVQNFYGAYDTTDTSFVTVDNQPLQTDTNPVSLTTDLQTGAEGSVTASTTSALTTNLAQARMELIETQNADQFRFKITAPISTKSVKLYVQNTADTTKSILGYAYKASDTSWIYRWDTVAVALGTYAVKAVAIQSDGVQLPTESITVTKSDTANLTPVSSTTNATSTEIKPVLKPPVRFDIQAMQPLKGIVTVKLDVAGAAQVEMYSQSKSSLIKKFLGQAVSIDNAVWMYQIDTKKLPNAEYFLIANVKNQYGTYETQSNSLKVFNEVPLVATPKEAEQIKVLTDIAIEIKDQEVSEESTPSTKLNTTVVTASTTNTDTTLDVEQETTQNLFISFRVRIDVELQRLASALRIGDTKAVEVSKAKLDSLAKEMVASNILNLDIAKLSTLIKAKLATAVTKVETDVKNTAKIIAKRTNEKASQDSDKDGIADYDEIAIYKTNPFKVDTDSDGFNDGAEILSNHNPIDATAEALVVFESPQEVGIVREDILEVSSIASTLKDGPDTDSKQKVAEALITGKALPNSFVTLYIFSTPIVVTLKTESDGSWNYRFDKELEDGEHQIYVGVTDNAGKIVAKSKPFAFVKVAEAFSPVTGEANVATPVAAPEKSFLSEYMIYLVLSISVVAIGLVLIVLGLHLDAQQRKYGVVTEATKSPA
jgi:hypothetical protein